MELLQNRVPNHQSSPIEGSRPPPYAALLHVKERNFDAIKEGPVSVDHINRLAIPAVTPTSMLVNLILGRHCTATRLGPGHMGPGPPAVAMEGPHPGLQGIRAGFVKHGEVRIPLGLKTTKGGI